MTSDSSLSTNRVIKNCTYLQDSLSELSSNTPSYTVEEVEGTYIKFKKTRITFQSIHSKESLSWVTPEVDSINFIDMKSASKTLFTDLLNLGYNSFFIREFAECEKHNTPFKDPEFNDVLIARHTGKSKLQEGDPICYYYHLNGGNAIFHRILEKDPGFWKELLRASKQTNLVMFSEVHLAADCSTDLMPYISTSVQQGHIETNGLHLNAYYRHNGVHKNGRVGKRSKTFKGLDGSDFHIQTLYIGSPKHSSISFCIYDKENEQRARKSSFSDCKTRIEARFKNRYPGALEKDLIESLISSYYVPNGSAYRTRVFLQELGVRVQFTTHYHKDLKNDLAPWWKFQVLSPLYHAALPFEGQELVFPLIEESNPPAVAGALPGKRGRGRPKGSKDKKPRRCKSRPDGFLSP